jgi:hypothetical protein
MGQALSACNLVRPAREWEATHAHAPHANPDRYGCRGGGVVTVVVTGSLPRTATTLSITASPTSIAADGSVKVSGVLTAGTSPVQRRPVFLCRYNLTTKKWVRVAAKRTGPQGVVFFVRAPSTTATFELVFPGGPRFAGSHSGTVTVEVAGQPGR